MRHVAVRDLIFDIGMSEGDDTDFYLKKGFRVVGVEADPIAFLDIQRRFESEIKVGSLTAINKAAFSEEGKKVDFFVNSAAQGHSRIIGGSAATSAMGQQVTVETTSWPDLVSLHGVPYYCKIDIEGAELEFIAGLLGNELPKFISVECHGFEPIEHLYRVGYRQFKLVNQNRHNAFTPPNPPREGNYLPGYKFGHSSGYFGEELPEERWLELQDVAVAFDAIVRLWRFGALHHIWFDCHAKC